jgi:hypothetical protein
MTQIKINKIYRNTETKDGKPYISQKTGKKYTKITIYFDQDDKEISASCLDFNGWCDWKVGDVVDVKLERNGDYLNFSRVTQADLLENRVKRLETAVATILKHLKKETPSKIEMPVKSKFDMRTNTGSPVIETREFYENQTI